MKIFAQSLDDVQLSSFRTLENRHNSKSNGNTSNDDNSTGPEKRKDNNTTEFPTTDKPSHLR